MRKLFSVLVMAMFLAACGSAAPAAEPTKAAEPAAEPTKAPEPTVVPTAEPAKPIVMVWLPNESGADLTEAREAITDFVYSLSS